MVNIKIDGKEISVEDRSTILDVARMVSIEIPTLCHYDGCEPFSSCMVCMVKDVDNDKFIPACSSTVIEGMNIETYSDELIVARREALELLLSNHIGDCEAICRIACPAFVDIPNMIRNVKRGDMNAAASALRDELALPRIVSRICHASCQKACKRGRVDDSISIQKIEKSVADYGYTNEINVAVNNENCKKIAIIGSGPTGLSVAFYLLKLGYSCVVFEKSNNIAPSLRNIIDLNANKEASDLGSDLSIEIIDKDIDVIKSMGCEFRTNIEIVKEKRENNHIAFNSLIEDYDAVVIVTGSDVRNCLVKVVNDVIEVDNATFQITNQEPLRKQRESKKQVCLPIKSTGGPTGGIKKVFAGGDAILPLGKIIFSVANGRELANSVNRFLIDGKVSAITADFDSRSGARDKAGIAAEVAMCDTHNKALLDDGNTDDVEIIIEAHRCLSCDCAKSTNCKLRDLSTKLDVTQSKFKADPNPIFSDKNNFSTIDKRIYGNQIIFDPGKCIKCGVCVRISEQLNEDVGLAFLGRGMDTHIGVPFDGVLDDAIKNSANECVNGCPTGALT